MHKILIVGLLLTVATSTFAQTGVNDSLFVRQTYAKHDVQIPMRDGVKLYTVIYTPADAGQISRYPILMERTPYSAGPYGEQNYPKTGPGPSRALSREKYIFVYQDVRGRYQSEGQFEEMTPHRSPLKTNESTDTYDTIEWLLKNVPSNNGRVGLVGISYPGFYASAALPDAHPALRAVSPQAPVTDEFIGDDARHNGAFFLMDNVSFMNYFDTPRKGPTADYDQLFAYQPKDVYDFYLKLGPVRAINGPAYFNRRGKVFNEYIEHDTYDAYWQSRNIRPHLKNVKPATLVVGGWYDAEDLFGALHTYDAIEKQSRGNVNHLVMGPWTHGAWARPDWSSFGPFSFGSNTAQTYRDSVETPFFNFYLKDKGTFNQPEARMFNTGTNRWVSFGGWPPAAAQPQAYYFNSVNTLTTSKPTPPNQFTEYVSDPAKPVPYTDLVSGRRNNQYMIEDQRFAARRPDVVTFQTELLTEDLTVAGPLQAQLFVSTTGTDADFIVKLIDVLPDSAATPTPNPRQLQMAGYQRVVRAEVIRGRFRNSFERPEPFRPGVVTEVPLTLPDAYHTFRRGHRLMVQVQHSWFPLIDRNPQTFKPMAEVTDADYQKATMRLYFDASRPSSLTLPVVK